MKTIKELSRYSSNMEQFADAVLSELSEGSGRGSRIIYVNNGTGLQFTVTPDHGMDIVDCSFRGIPLVFRTPVGYASPYRYEPTGFGWLRNWPGGLMSTVGLRNAGGPNGEFGLHGRIGNQQADQTGIEKAMVNGAYTITLKGTLREAAMFGEHLELRRTITTAYGRNTIEVKDTITNCGCTPESVLLLYHCNFGYPLVSPSMRFLCKEHKIIARTPNAEEGIGEWNQYPEPIDGYIEQCFFHELPKDEDGTASMAIENPDIHTQVKITYPVGELKRMVQWKNPLAGMYVLGLEPTNCMLLGHTEEVEKGMTRILAAGETMEAVVKFEFKDI